MTQGVLLFANNNSEIAYTDLAIFAAQQITKYLNVPVSIVTDSKPSISKNVFDKIIEITDNSSYTKRFHDGTDSNKTLHWKNTSRSRCYELTPYDETLVIDVDYIVNSTTLNYCWNQPHDFLIYSKYCDLAQWRSSAEFDHVSEYSVPFYWATVFFFRKTELNKQFFDLITHIKLNWVYYKFVYQIQSTNFRNDYAYSIAIHMMNGFTNGVFANQLPSKMFYTLDTDFLIDIDGDTMKFLVEKQNTPGEYTALKTSGLDVHVMNKYSLLRCVNNE
jgi:hypothetical protein